jgi:mono/diheme cytochrome c family protein
MTRDWPLRMLVIASALFPAAAAAFAGAAPAQGEGQAGVRSVWSGVYTDAQGRRGHAAYLNDCARCHGENLMGGDDAVPLAGEAFLSNWDGRTAADLFDKIRVSMPDDDPGTLPRERVADLVAYLLNENGFPSGSRELAHETAPLKQIRIDAKQP